MSLKLNTPCDWEDCPYGAWYGSDCEYYCGAEEPADNPELWEEEQEEKPMTEMQKLIQLLATENIPLQVTINWIDNSQQVWYPNQKDAICDVICHRYSYGGKEGLLEIMGLSEMEDDDVEGWLTAEDVFKRIKEHAAAV